MGESNCRMKRKLLISVSNNYLYDRRMQRIADELNKKFDVTIFAVRKVNHAVKSAKYRYKIHYASLPFSNGVLFYLFLNIRLFFFVLINRFDVVYAVDLDTLSACTLGKGISKYKLVFDAHEYFSEVPELHGRTCKKKVWTSIGHYGIKRADLCYTVNKPLSKILGKKYKKQFHVLRNMPFKLKKDSNAFFSKEKIILYQGAVNKGRGLEEAIKAMCQLPNYKLIIVGEGDLYESLSNYVRNNQIHNVVFTGYVTPDKLHEYTNKAFIGLNLIASYSLNYYYSLANKFFDYVQSGVPSINMDYPVYASLNAEYEVSVLISDLKVEQIISAVRHLENISFYETLRAECVKASKLWIWEHERKVLSLVNDLFC